MNPEPTDDTSRNVVLTGFMGTGKTTVGRILAKRLGYAFVDTDTIIEERHGPIPEIFAAQGEDAFRAIERALAVELAERRRHVISTGGGMLVDDASTEALARSSDIFCLIATPDEILERVAIDPSRAERPLLAVEDPARRISELLAERADAYARFAQVVTSGRRPTEVADIVIAARP
jgi:shikimate kinase